MKEQDEAKCCGDCKFFSHECIDGSGLCDVHRKPLVVECDKKACVWFKERKQE